MASELVRWALPFWLLLATVVLLPFGVGPEVPILIGAVAGAVALLRGRIDWQQPEVKLAVMLGLGYWLPEFVSAWDSLSPDKSWSEVGLDLRLVLFLIFIANHHWSQGEQRGLVQTIAVVALLWCLDALVQAATGWSLGGPIAADRLSGIFGAGNLKLGGVLAVLAPFALWQSWHWRGWPMLLLVSLMLLLVILLAGARAAWLGFGLAAVLIFGFLLGWRRAVAALSGLAVATITMIVLAYVASPRFAERVDRTIAATSIEAEGIDHALTGRPQIWVAAWRMGLAHPVNGVGVRAFRHAYADFADADDHFLAQGEQVLHAHQIVLELWSETGLVGVGLWLVLVWLAWRHLRRMPQTARRKALPATVALIVALFPFNTHYAVYSGFWGLFLIWLLAVWLALLQTDQRRPQ